MTSDLNLLLWGKISSLSQKMYKLNFSVITLSNVPMENCELVDKHSTLRATFSESFFHQAIPLNLLLVIPLMS